MAQKKTTAKKNKEKELFTICVKISDNGKGCTVNLSCMKDDKEGDFGLIQSDENLGNAFEGMKYATSILASLWVRQLHANGKLSDEEFDNLMSVIKGGDTKKALDKKDCSDEEV